MTNPDEPENIPSPEGDGELEPPDEAAENASAPGWFDSEVPEYYSDTINVETSPYGLAFTFGVRRPGRPRPKARVFMSYEMAIVFSRLLRRVILTNEATWGHEVKVPDGILASLRIQDSDLSSLQAERDEAVTPKGDSNGDR